MDGGRLNTHKARQKDLRRRKDGRLKGDNVSRSKNGDKIEFDKIDPTELEIIKTKIRTKAKKGRRIEVILILISAIMAILLFFWFTNRYNG